MIPNNDGLPLEYDVGTLPTRTYFLHISKDTIVGFCDEIQAMAQTIYCMLSTERYDYIIYSWNYGVEFHDLYGKDVDYVMVESERRIEEALLMDERIQDVSGFTFNYESGNMKIDFTVTTVYGELNVSHYIEV